jgi:estrone sulfotransferase
MIFRAAKSHLVQKKLMPPIRIRPDDVFIASYPKSGNTWLRFLLANLLAPGEKITFRNIDNYVPDIYKCAGILEDRRGRRYIKSHHPCYELYPKLIYIYRDGRDALVSYYHYASGKKKFAGTFAEFVFSSFVTKFSSWSEHVEGACDFAVKHPDRILMLQYEEMLKNASAGAAGISAFLELGCDDQAIARAVEASSFHRLKKSEQQFGGEKLAKPVPFFRHGDSGQWRERFNPELYRRYCDENGATLVRLGYKL